MRSFMWSEFLSFERHGDVRIEKVSSLGMPPWNPPRIFKNIQASKLGDAQGIPTLHQQSSGRFVETTFLSLCILCAMLGASFLLSVLFVILLVICLLDPCFICVGERHAPLFIWILLCFAYILLSILSYCLFASKLWYVHFASLFYIIIYLYLSIYFIIWCNTYVILSYFACLATIGDASAGAGNQLEKYMSRYLTSEAPKIPEKFEG